MTSRLLTQTAALLLTCLTWSNTTQAKDMRDTLTSDNGDRIIVEYGVTQSQGKVTLTFYSVQKKLGERNRKKYKKLDKVTAVFFDRAGTYGDTKFEGMSPAAFMVPAGVEYNYSADGYFFIQDNPTLQFTVNGDKEMSIPVFLANYEGKEHYKIFSRCKDLQFSTKGAGAGGGGGSRTGRGGGGGGGTEVISSEELLDEGVSPAVEAEHRMKVLAQRLAEVEEPPFPDDLNEDITALKALRYRITDDALGAQIDKLLAECAKKKKEIAKIAEQEDIDKKNQEKLELENQRKVAEARQDSIQAAQEKKADEKQKDMMMLIGGIAALGMLVMGGKQIFQTIKNNKMQKMMMDNLNKAQQQALGNVNIPGVDPNNPMVRDINQQLQRDARKTMTKEGEAAKKKLQAMRNGGGDAAAAQKPAGPQQPAKPAAPATEPAKPGKRPLRTASQVKAEAMGKTNTQDAGLEITTKPQKPSLNDVIPKNYRRWRKPGTPDTNK